MLIDDFLFFQIQCLQATDIVLTNDFNSLRFQKYQSMGGVQNAVARWLSWLNE
jgi:hypothetical protein